MSLSQKHSGKVLVPWFNIAEWKYVFDLIYSESTQDWPRALQILQIWKHRTPLLSAGVEGTLIILEALLVSTQLSSYELTHIYSTSLVRFLNLCAANNDKQGTFYKTAMQNDLPKWLISIRHEIAHSHKVPSESMLILSLKFCLEWLKGKYWDIQYENMSDFIAKKEFNTTIEDCVYIYQNLESNKVIQENQELIKRIGKVVKHNQKLLKRSNIVEDVNSAFKEAIMKNKTASCEKICQLLIDDLVILTQECDVMKNGSKKIPVHAMKKWEPLLNSLLEAEILPNFTDRLFSITLQGKYELKYQEVASLWIKYIFLGLINIENGSEDETCVSFKSDGHCMKMKEFANQVTRRLSSFTVNFVKEVLQYNNAPPQFIEDTVNLVATFNTAPTYKSDKIFTLEDLNFSLEDCNISNSPPTEVIATPSESRWTLIEDTSPYMNLPLGVLPHQVRDVNPLLEL